MPCDGRSHDHRHAEMVDVLREVEHTMLKYDANYTIFGGVLNTDISRSTPHTASFLEFVREYDMTICIEMGHVNIPYTYMCERVMKHSHQRLIIVLYVNVYVIISVNVLL